MQDAWRAYLEMALGLTEAPRKKAQKVAGDLVNRSGATAAQLQGLVEDLMSTGMANREALTNIVRYEVDRALGVVGLATADEVADLTTRVRDLERQLRQAQSRVAAAEAASGSLIATEAAGADGGIGGDRLNLPAPLPARTAKKTVAKKAVTSPPNAMPKAAAPRPAANAGGPAGPRPAKAAKKAGPAAKKVGGAASPDAGPTRTTSPGPAGTAEPPVAPVTEAAAATELPPTAGTTSPAPAKAAELPPTAGTTSSAPAKAAKKAAAKKAAKKAPAPRTTPDVADAAPAQAALAKKAAPGPTEPEA